jgi:hypothetical protein
MTEPHLPFSASSLNGYSTRIFGRRVDLQTAEAARRPLQLRWCGLLFHTLDHNCRNQAISQVCAFPSPFCVLLSEMGIFRQVRPRPFDLQCRISSHGVSYGVQEGRIAFRENFSLEVRESQLSLRI